MKFSTHREYLSHHMCEAVGQVFERNGQNVELIPDGMQYDPLFYVFDSPEYDYQWHRANVQVTVQSMTPCAGNIRVQLFNGDMKDQKWFNFDGLHSFGDALIAMQNWIEQKIKEDA